MAQRKEPSFMWKFIDRDGYRNKYEHNFRNLPKLAFVLLFLEFLYIVFAVAVVFAANERQKVNGFGKSCGIIAE